MSNGYATLALAAVLAAGCVVPAAAHADQEVASPQWRRWQTGTVVYQSLAGVGGGIVGGGLGFGVATLAGGGGLGGALVAIVVAPVMACVGAGVGSNWVGDARGGDGSAGMAMLGAGAGALGGGLVAGIVAGTVQSATGDSAAAGGVAALIGVAAFGFGAAAGYQLSASEHGGMGPRFTLSEARAVVAGDGRVIGMTLSLVRMDW